MHQQNNTNMKTLHQLINNMLVHELQNHLNAPGEFLETLVYTEYDKTLEFYNFKNSAIDPIGTAEDIAQFLKNNPYAKDFDHGEILLKEGENEMLYHLVFNVKFGQGKDLIIDLVSHWGFPEDIAAWRQDAEQFHLIFIHKLG